METFIKERDENAESNLLTPQIMEIRAEVELNKNHVNSFMQYFESSLKLKCQQTGKYSYGVGLSYCNFAKYLNLLGNTKRANEMLNKAARIFINLPSGHPIMWPLYYYYGILE